MIKIHGIDVSDVIVKKLGPSTFTSLLTGCRYAYLLQHTSSKKAGNILPNARATSIGNVIHAMFEERTKGLLPDETAFERRWEELVSKEERTIRETYDLKEYSLCDYDRMYCAMKTAMSMEAWKPQSGKSADVSVQKCSIEVEKKYETENLVGKIDRVECTGGKTVIVDYKTGQVFDENGEIKDDYSRQLNLYSYMYQRERNAEVDRLEIMDTSGTRYDVNIWDQKRLADELKLVEDVIDSINNAAGDKSSLAKPSDRCSLCSARMICEPYWNSGFRIEADPDDPNAVFEDQEVFVSSIIDKNSDVAEYPGGRIKGLSRFTSVLSAGKRYRFRGLVLVGNGYSFGNLYSTCRNTIVMEVE